MAFPEPGCFLGKSFSSEPEKQTAGKVPGRRLKIIVLRFYARFYASTIATISCVRGLMITI
jgi:hypothetical protein